MRGFLLKCSGEQVRKATDAEWLGVEPRRSGQRGYVDVEPEGRPTEESPVDRRPDIHQVWGAAVPASGPDVPIPEDAEVVNPEIQKAMETGQPTRPRQPEKRTRK